MADRLMPMNGRRWNLRVSRAAWAIVVLSSLLAVPCCRRAGDTGPADAGQALAELRVRRLVLVDADDVTRAVLETREDGVVRLALLDEGRAAKVDLTVDAKSAGIYIRDPLQDRAIDLGVTNEVGPVISLLHRNKRRAGVIIDKGGEIMTSIWDVNGTERARFGLKADGIAYMWLGDGNGRPRTAIIADSFGGCGLDHAGQDGAARVRLSLDADGEANIVVYERDGSILWSETAP